MELRRSSWMEVMCLPYQFFISDLKWKMELEEEKNKRIQETKQNSASKAHSRLRQKNNKR